MNFKERFQAGECTMDVIHDLTELWHKKELLEQPLQQFLGLSCEEYQTWLQQGDKGLAAVLSKCAGPRYRAIHLEWDELQSRIQELIVRILPCSCHIVVKRTDYYYWDLYFKFEDTVDEALSARICELLDLEDVAPDHFVFNDSVDGRQLYHLLERLTDREVSSSHADDYGVWIICKELRAASSEYAERLIRQCERRLRREIRSKQYPMIDQDAACHQLFGFIDALCMLGLISREQHCVAPDHFSGCTAQDSALTGVQGGTK